MKKSVKILATSLVFSLILQTAAMGLAFSSTPENPDTKSDSDPYALMYDSNERLAEKIDAMPEIAEDAPLTQENALATQSDPDNDAGDEDLTGRLIKQETKQKLLELVTAGEFDKLEALDLSDKLKDRVEALDESVKTDRFIVKYRTDAKDSLSSLMTKKAAEFNVLSNKRLGNTELMILDERVNPQDFADMLKSAGASASIEYIQPDFKLDYAATEGSIGLEISDGGTEEPAITDEPDSEQPFGGEDQSKVLETAPSAPLEGILPSEAEEIEQTTPEVELPIATPEAAKLSEVIVAVIDSGIDTSHPGLADYIWENTAEIDDDGIDNDENGYVDDATGWNFCDDSNAIYDESHPLQSAHGTHIAGIIAQLNEDYDVKIIPLKVFGDNGAYTSDIIDAIYYAEANGAKIVNCSFGSTDNNPALKEAMENSGMLFVTSAGNARSDLSETPIYPACFGLANIISVTSSNEDGGLSYYSNYSADLIDVAAPGRDINSTLPDGEYGIQSGTSMSAAQVAGAAAAVLSTEPGLDAKVLKDRLISTADMLSNLQETVIDGRQINLNNAVNNQMQNAVVQNDPEDDFNVKGYHPTQAELYELYSSSGDVVQVAAGYTHSLILKENGTVWAWGGNRKGQCGNGTTSVSESLTQVIGLTDVIQISTFYDHSVALKEDGTVWAWGANWDGQLGDGTLTGRSAPVQVPGLTKIEQVSAGEFHSLALTSGGAVWTWGYYTTEIFSAGFTSPVYVEMPKVKQISAGAYHSLALQPDGQVWMWGYSGSYENTSEMKACVVSGMTGVKQVFAGSYESLAVKSDGTVWGWGDRYWTIGPCVQMGNLTEVVLISRSSNSHSFAVTSDGTVRAWGNNSYGQLGDGTITNQSWLVQVIGLTDVVQIVAGSQHSLALKSDGTVWGWGDNSSYQLGIPNISNSLVPIQLQTSAFSISFSESSYEVTIPESGQITHVVVAQATGVDGNIITNAAITYSLKSPYSGVSINATTGTVTIASQAQAGSVEINATYEGFVGSTVLSLISVSTGGSTELSLSATSGNTYLVSLTGDDISSFDGKTYKLTYDATTLAVKDLCAFTYVKETTTGTISRTGITITSVKPGEIVMTMDKTIPSGKVWSGVLNTLEFKALSTSSTVVTIGTDG